MDTARCGPASRTQLITQPINEGAIMNHSSTSTRSGISQFALIVLATLLAIPAFAAQFQQGDEIKLTRDEPLDFRYQVSRQAKSGDTFSVSRHRRHTRRALLNGT